MVEIKESPKIVVAKPVACRPTLSGLRSFSELVSGAVSAPPQPPAICEPAVAVIRPKTIRFKPAANVDSVGDEGCGPAACRPSERVLITNIAPNVVYKPIAKLVSKRTVSLLANLGGGCGVIPRPEIADSETPISPWNQDKPQTELATDFHQSLPSKLAMLNASVENTEDNIKLPVLPHIGDRSSYDGHSWRKYGQKQVKGSEYPRSYYKCTQPNCPVKKKVEKTLDGQIAEIVYSGEHNHSKPQLLNRIETPHEGCEGGSENPRIMGSSMHSPWPDATLPVNDIVATTCNASVSTSNNSLSQGGFEEVSESLVVEGDELRSKRAKHENKLLKASPSGETLSAPRTVVRDSTDSDTIGDGFRWRKYGQKVVKGNPYPRSYYRCTSPKCNARKYVERTSEEDPGSFITTYEGRHNHGIPTKSTHSEASKKTCKNKS